MRKRVHHIIYVALTCLLAVAIPTSNFVMNMAWVFLFANWTIEGDFRAKWERAKQSRLLWAFAVFFAVHLAGLLWSENLAYGLDDIRKKLPLIAIPIVLLTSEAFSPRERRHVSFCYVVTLLVVTFIGLVRHLTMPDLPYRDIVPFISHIRFCLNLCLAVCLLLWAGIAAWSRGAFSHARLFGTACMLIAVWFLLFLAIMQSYTSAAVLGITFASLLAFYWKALGQKARATGSKSLSAGRWAALALFAGTLIAGAMTVRNLCQDYYRLTPLAALPSPNYTANGNAYEHHPNGVIENGGYIDTYICRVEMEQEWAKRSKRSVDAPSGNGYSIYSTLVRYLNASGVTKDSAGIATLSDEDIRNVEKGIANPVYLKTVSLRRMVYVLLYERECYLHCHAVRDFSMLQRYELWQNGWKVFLKQPIFGTGTGDVVDLCHAQLESDSSPLAGTSKHTHNQYLTLLITFGAVGFLLIAFTFGRCFRRGAAARLMTLEGFLLASLVSIALVSFFTEDTLETLAGQLFVCFFLCYTYKHVSISHAR